MGNLQSKFAVVTGAGSGAGKAIAIALASQGAYTFCIGRRKFEIEKTVSLIKESNGRADAIVCDVSNAIQVEAVFKKILHWGNVDILINNAAAFGATAFTEDQTVDSWIQCLNTNILGAALCNKAVIPGMKQQRSGYIIHISSLATSFAYTKRNPYATSKHGLEGLSEVTAGELCEYGICVNTVAPGHITGERLDAVIQARSEVEKKDVKVVRRAFLSQYHLHRDGQSVILDPEDVAEMVLFLTTTKAGSKITGETFGMKCGFRL